MLVHGHRNQREQPRTTTPAPVPGMERHAGLCLRNRGTYVGLNVNSLERYHAAYGDDTYAMNRFVTFDAGVRWERSVLPERC